MDKIDQYLYLIDDIASIYGKILNFSAKTFIMLVCVKMKIAMWGILLKD